LKKRKEVSVFLEKSRGDKYYRSLGKRVRSFKGLVDTGNLIRKISDMQYVSGCPYLAGYLDFCVETRLQRVKVKSGNPVRMLLQYSLEQCGLWQVGDSAGVAM
jgi:hypothetical protein